MDQRRKTNRFCVCVLLWAALLRLAESDLTVRLLSRMKQVDIAPFLIYLETGRNVRFSPSDGVFFDHFRESPPPLLPEPPEQELPCFSGEDTHMVELYYGCSVRPELEPLLAEPLDWDLTGQEPSVLILHTHTTESYTRTTEPYVETSRYRTLDEAYNMLSIGDRVAKILEDAGVRVIHDRQIHDYPSYNGSYTHARAEIKALLEQNPGIRLVLDLHRDASGSPGRQLRTEVYSEGEPCAQLMLVVGTGSGGLTHKNWERNLSLALKLHVQLERQTPGIMRPLSLRSQRFNQDLIEGALLVEVGAAGNTHGEALRAAEELARAVAALSGGTEEKA